MARVCGMATFRGMASLQSRVSKFRMKTVLGRTTTASPAAGDGVPAAAEYENTPHWPHRQAAIIGWAAGLLLMGRQQASRGQGGTGRHFAGRCALTA